MPFSIYQKIGSPKLKPSNAYLTRMDGTQNIAMGELDDHLIRIGELIILVDFVVLDMDQDDEEEPYLQLGRPFMETTKMELDMEKGTIKMTVLGRTLRVDIIDGDSPT